VADCPQHAETAGLADGGDDVTAMTESKEREFASHHFTDSGLHSAVT